MELHTTVRFIVNFPTAVIKQNTMITELSQTNVSLWNTKMSQTWACEIQKCLKHEPVEYKNVSNMSLWTTKMSQTWACEIQKRLKHEQW